MVDQTLITTLNHVGFDEKEAKVYLALLELGNATATAIAERAGLKRAVVYLVVERLKKSGYALEIRKGAVKKFAVVDPMRVLQNVRTAADDLKFMLPLLRALQDKGRETPRIEFLEGEEAVLSVWLHLEAYPQIRYTTSMKRLYELIPGAVEAWMKRYDAGRITASAKHLVTDTPLDREWAKKMKQFNTQEVRFLAKGKMMEMDFSMVSDMLVITSFEPLYSIVVHSERIAQSAALLFDSAFAGSEA